MVELMVNEVTNLSIGDLDLNDRQKKFCEEYLIDLNATAAYVRAGYSAHDADANAARLMGNDSIRMYVQNQMAERTKRTGVNADRVVRELARLGFVNPALVVGKEGEILDSATEDDLAAISSIKVKTTTGKNGVTIERDIKFHDKNKSLELLAKHMGMLIDRKQVDVRTTVEEMTDDQRRERIRELMKTLAIDIEVVE